MSIQNQPEFEAETDSTVTVADPVVAPSVAAAAQEASAVVARASTAAAVAAPSKGFRPAFAEQKGFFDVETVSGMSLNSTRLKGEQGSIFADQEDLGDLVRFEIISWNSRWAIGTGTDDKEAREHFRVSYDNKTLDGDPGTTVAAYLEGLRAQGYPKAKASPYIDLWGFVTWSRKQGDVDPEQRQIVCVQCSQTSAGAFSNFCMGRGMMESKGLVQPLTEIAIKAEKRVNGTNKYTNFSFHAPSQVA